MHINEAVVVVVEGIMMLDVVVADEAMGRGGKVNIVGGCWERAAATAPWWGCSNATTYHPSDLRFVADAGRSLFGVFGPRRSHSNSNLYNTVRRGSFFLYATIKVLIPTINLWIAERTAKRKICGPKKQNVRLERTSLMFEDYF